MLARWCKPSPLNIGGRCAAPRRGPLLSAPGSPQNTG